MSRVRPVIIRSLLVTEVAGVLARDRQWPYQQATITMRPQGGGDSIVLFASDSYDVLPQVARGEVQLAIVNPSEPLTMAVRGTGPFKEPLPLRAIAVIPSQDAFVFAVSEQSGLTSLQDIRDRRYPLRLSLRGQRDHSVHLWVQEVLAAVGISLADIESWGGQVRYDHGLPGDQGRLGQVEIDTNRLQLAERGDIDAIFEESVRSWTPRALDMGWRILSLDEPLVQKLEAMGFRRAIVPRSHHPSLQADVLTLDFSGWPIYTHAETPDEVVTAFCVALDASKERIPWQGEGPLPLESMVKDSPQGPLDVPLHPAAERFWRQRGYL